MRAHAEEGDVAGALRIYKALWDLLDRDYAMEPSSATEELVANIKLGVLERTPADRAASAANDEFAVRMVRGTALQPVAPMSPSVNASARTRLVLRPFAMHGVDEDHSHLVQGFSQHLAACLVRFREWSVVDRPPAAVVLPASGTAPQYCIETTAYQAGAEINIVMVLRDDTTGIYVWSESFRLGLGNWFETQQRIIRRIATSLERAVVDRAADAAGRRARRFARSSRPLAARPESHRRSSTGKLAAGGRDLSRLRSAKIRLSRRCYSSLVQMNNIEHLVHPGVLRDLDKAKATLELAKTAVRTRSGRFQGASLLRLVLYDGVARGRGGAAHGPGLRAERQRSVDAAVQRSLLRFLRLDRAGSATRRANRLRFRWRPHDLEWGYHCIIRFLCGDYAGAIEACDRANNVIQTLPAWRAAALFELGQPELAREEAQRFRERHCARFGSDQSRRPTRPSRAGSCKRTRSASGSDGKPCATACVAQGFRSKVLRHCPGDKAVRGFQAQALMV